MKKLFFVLCLVFLLVMPITQAQDGESEVSEMLNEGAESVALGDLLLKENFDDDDAWEQFSGSTSDLRVDDGAYLIDVEGSSIIWGLREIEHSDVVINIEASQLSSDKVFSAYGVMCRADTSNNGDGYYFFVGSDGTAVISVGVGSSVDPVADPVATDAINTGHSTNIITAVCVDDYLALYVNGELVIETNDDTFSSGYLGIAAQSVENSAAQLSFDNALVWETGEGGTSTTVTIKDDEPAGKPQALQNHNADDWRDAIAELQDEGLIGSGGSLVFNENYTYFAGQGNWFTPLARNSPFSDIVMAGEITFNVGNLDDFETCNLSSRIVLSGSGTQIYLDVGILNSGDLLIIDRFSTSEDAMVDFWPLSLDLGQPHHLLYILQDDLLTVYIDGELVREDIEVTDRSGVYGISLIGRGTNARCEGRNVWVYQVPVFRPGVCEASTARSVNRREGPGTDYASPGQMASGTIMQVTGQTTGNDGFTWWQLEDGSWVRDDIVNVAGDCAGVPQTD